MLLYLMGGNPQVTEDDVDHKSETLIERTRTRWTFQESETDCSKLIDLVECELHIVLHEKIYRKEQSDDKTSALVASPGNAEKAVELFVDLLLRNYTVTPNSAHGIQLVSETTDGKTKHFVELQLRFDLKSMPNESVLLTELECTLKLPVFDVFVEDHSTERHAGVWTVGKQEARDLRLLSLPTRGFKDWEEFKKALGID